MVVIIDYGMGNLRSILHKLHKIKVEAIISSDAHEIRNAHKLILPGVGHFAQGMANLKEYGLIETLTKAVGEEGIPILGICLGIQLFTNYSEEGDGEGLGWINARTKRFVFDETVKQLQVPHVGWNTLSIEKSNPLLEGVQENQRFYFTHSYHVVCADHADVIATSHYGYEFAASIQRGNIYGTQFHPEKSHIKGFEIIKNFIKLREYDAAASNA